jgi:hypothetical protein
MAGRRGYTAELPKRRPSTLVGIHADEERGVAKVEDERAHGGLAGCDPINGQFDFSRVERVDPATAGKPNALEPLEVKRFHLARPWGESHLERELALVRALTIVAMRRSSVSASALVPPICSGAAVADR